MEHCFPAETVNTFRQNTYAIKSTFSRYITCNMDIEYNINEISNLLSRKLLRRSNATEQFLNERTLSLGLTSWISSHRAADVSTPLPFSSQEFHTMRWHNVCTAVPSTDYFQRRLRNTAVGNQSPTLFRIQSVAKVYNKLGVHNYENILYKNISNIYIKIHLIKCSITIGSTYIC